MADIINSKRWLIIFDMDLSLIDANSDLVVQELASAATRSELDARMATKPQWTDFMDEVLVKLQILDNVTVEQIAAIMTKIPFHDDMKLAIREAKSHGADLIILSDANDFFIDTILDFHGCSDIFSEIITNPTFIDEKGLLRVRRVIAPNARPHGCPRCPPNLCKGAELQRYISQASQSYTHLVYIGDSKNDICPTLRLSSSDTVLARQDYGLHHFWTERINTPSTSDPQLLVWSSGSDVLKHFRNLLDHNIRLDINTQNNDWIHTPATPAVALERNSYFE